MTTLVADIGGTNARFGLVDDAGTLHAVRRLAVKRHPRFEDALDDYLSDAPARPLRACLAVAGPSRDGRVSFTNSPWIVDGEAIARDRDLDRCVIVNDFQAISRFAALARPDDLLRVKEGVAIEGAPILTIGPGTGLGQGLLVPTRGGPLTIATEGGHVVLATRNAEEATLAARLTLRLGRTATAEDALSGSGLERLYEAIAEGEGAVAAPLAAAEITKAALAGDALCLRTVNAFFELLATTASNAALATGARGGVMLTGGILPRMPDLLVASRFAERFVGDSKMRSWTGEVPVNLLVTDGAALLGAAALLGDEIAR